MFQHSRAGGSGAVQRPAFLSAPTHTHTHTHTHIYMHTHIYIHTHTHTHIYIYTHTHTYIYTHTHTHIYIYICTHSTMHDWEAFKLQHSGLFNISWPPYFLFWCGKIDLEAGPLCRMECHAFPETLV